MKAPDSQAPLEMNWVDYCDALSNGHIWPRAQLQKPSQVPQHTADPLAVAPSRQETAREST